MLGMILRGLAAARKLAPVAGALARTGAVRIGGRSLGSAMKRTIARVRGPFRRLSKKGGFFATVMTGASALTTFGVEYVLTSTFFNTILGRGGAGMSYGTASLLIDHDVLIDRHAIRVCMNSVENDPNSAEDLVVWSYRKTYPDGWPNDDESAYFGAVALLLNTNTAKYEDYVDSGVFDTLAENFYETLGDAWRFLWSGWDILEDGDLTQQGLISLVKDDEVLMAYGGYLAYVYHQGAQRFFGASGSTMNAEFVTITRSGEDLSYNPASSEQSRDIRYWYPLVMQNVRDQTIGEAAYLTGLGDNADFSDAFSGVPAGGISLRIAYVEAFAGVVGATDPFSYNGASKKDSELMVLQDLESLVSFACSSSDIRFRNHVRQLLEVSVISVETDKGGGSYDAA